MSLQTAKLRYLRMAPRKVRLIAAMLKGLSVNEAEAQLLLNPRRASDPILKLLRSAVSNAKNNKLDLEKLIVKEIRVDKGPILKRWLPRAQGRATPIHKISSHVTIVLEESQKGKQPRFKIVKPEKIRKAKAEKIKAEQAKEAEKKPEKPEMKEVKPEKRGFAQRIFRRKSI